MCFHNSTQLSTPTPLPDFLFFFPITLYFSSAYCTLTYPYPSQCFLFLLSTKPLFFVSLLLTYLPLPSSLLQGSSSHLPSIHPPQPTAHLYTLPLVSYPLPKIKKIHNLIQETLYVEYFFWSSCS